MNRYDLQELADLRITEARVLLDNGYYVGAYHLMGYAVECALKACVARQTNRYDFPDLRFVRDSHTHNLSQLLTVSGLNSEHDNVRQSDLQFGANWAAVIRWSEQSRYTTSISREEAENLYSAITNPENGVLTWLKEWW
jgi:HEPN domain-containing protein